MLDAYKNNQIFEDGTVERDFLDSYIAQALEPLDLDEYPDF